MENEERKPNCYLFRWNPTISSFKLEHYRKAVLEHTGGFSMDWSIYEWEDAHEGDIFFMLRVGDDQAGIIFWGEIVSEPYEDDDWAGQKGKKRHYVDINCYSPLDPDDDTLLTTEILQREMPGIDWVKGHSGELLTEEQTEKLKELGQEYMVILGDI